MSIISGLELVCGFGNRHPHIRGAETVITTGKSTRVDRLYGVKLIGFDIATPYRLTGLYPAGIGNRNERLKQR